MKTTISSTLQFRWLSPSGRLRTHRIRIGRVSSRFRKSKLAKLGLGWREKLCFNLATLVDQLRTVGITEIFIDGSFVEDKDHPNDIDGYFECDLHELASGELQRQLNLLDPHKVWTWDPEKPKASPGFLETATPDVASIPRGTLSPLWSIMLAFRDEHGHELTFPSAFRQARDHTPRGIVKIVE